MGKYGIKIYARVKPTKKATGDYSVEELEDGGHSITIYVPKSEQGGYVNNKKELYNFRFNDIFEQKAKQDEVFETVARDVIDNCLEGYNGTVFAYGQTGSGKTFTITGGVEKYEDRGIIPRVLSYLFSKYSESAGRMFTTHVSYLEIYNDSGYDLLAPKSGSLAALEDLPKVTIMEGEDGIHLKNLALHPATNEEEALNWLFLGDTNRMIAETPMNMASTRSHCIFTVHISSREPGCSTIRKAKLHLVDLAGSERVGKTGAKGTLLQEAKYINTSLFFLEQVIVALSEKSRSHIPYRNSMMTSVLRDSLGGNCKTTMIATCAVDKKNIDETISTCRFAQRVALVKNEAVLNEELDPKLMVQKLKQKVQELKEELQLATGEERTDELTAEEKAECKELLEIYLQDTSPEAVLQVGRDMRKIKYCFALMKVEIMKLRSAESAEAKTKPQEKAKEDQQPPGNKSDVKSLEDGQKRSRTPVTQDQDAILKLELEMFQERLRQRDGEINVLLRMLKQERKRASRAEEALTAAGIPMRTVSPASPDRLSPVHLSRKKSKFSSERFEASKEGLVASAEKKRDDTGQGLSGTGENVVHDTQQENRKREAAGSDNTAASKKSHSSSDDWQAALKEELARARQESFNIFKKNHADTKTLEYLRKNLMAKYAEAKEFGEKLNNSRLYVNKLKARIEKYRIARQLHEGTDLSSAKEDEKEEELKKELKVERAKFKEQCEVLAQMKSEAEHLQHLLQKTKVKIQRDFEAYWNSQHLSKPKRTPRSSPREVSRSTAGANLGEIPSLGKEGGNKGDRMGEGDRMVSPRTAWKTPPGYESLKGAGGDSSGSLALAQTCSQGARTSDSFSRQSQGSTAARFRRHALDRQSLVDPGSKDRTSPRRKLDSVFRTGSRNGRHAIPGLEVEANVDSFKVSSSEKTWSPAVSIPGAKKDLLDEDVRKRATSSTQYLTSPRNIRCSEEVLSPRAGSLIPLTGDQSADKDIIAFYKARQKLIDRTTNK